MVQVNSFGASGTTFSGAYAQRMLDNRMREAAQAYQQEAPRQTARDILGDDVSIKLSNESQAFLDGAAQRKAAASAAPAAQETQAAPADPFAGTSDFKKQYLVFSEHLFDAGFYDRMSDAAVREAERLLRDITSSMDAISPNSLMSSTEYAPSAAGAQVAYASSVEALHQFADQYLEGDLKESFKGLIGDYEAHNRPIVEKHRNVRDRMDSAMAKFSQSKFYNKAGASSDTSRTTAAKLGAIQHTAEQNRKVREAVTASFREIRSGRMSIDAAIHKAQNAFLSYASDGAQNGSMRSLLIQRNSAMFAQMSAYWGVLMHA